MKRSARRSSITSATWSEIPLRGDDADEEQGHDDGAHGRRDVAVDAGQSDLAEDRDECGTECREQCIDEPGWHEDSFFLKFKNKTQKDIRPESCSAADFLFLPSA
jgi:hypothetical protein